MQTQCQRIIEYIKKNGSITNLQAKDDLGILCLSARMSNLRQAGYKVITKRESGLNRYGEKTSFCRYYIDFKDGNDNG